MDKFFSILLGFFLLLSVSARAQEGEGYLETVQWWQDVTQEIQSYSQMLRDRYRKAEIGCRYDGCEVALEFQKLLALDYPGSTYSPQTGGVWQVNGYTCLSYDEQWYFTELTQTFEHLSKIYDFQQNLLTLTAGRNRISIILNPEVPQQSIFALAEIPALAVSAAAVYEKQSPSRTTISLLADLLNDVYAGRFAEEGKRMDELAQELLEDEGTQQQILLLAEEIYSTDSTDQQQVETAADPVAVSQPPAPEVVPAPVAVGPASDSLPPPRSNGAFWGLLAVWVTLSILFIWRALRLIAFRSAAQEGEDDADPEASEDAVAGAAEEIPRQWSLEVLQALEWKRFETVCYEYLRATGYRPRETRVGFDGAVDFKVYMPDIEKPVGLVRCRGGMTGRIDVQALRDLLDVMTEAKIRNGKFITSGEFAPEAAAFAHGRNLQLLSGRELLASLLRLPGKDRLKLLRMAVRGDYHTPTCPRCGNKMILRAGPGETFWECPKYPRCQATMRRIGKNNQVECPL